MRLFKRKTNDIKVPTGWDQITIGQYEEILQHQKTIVENKHEDTYESLELILDAKIKTISVATRRPVKDISKQLLSTIYKQYDQIVSFISEPQELKFVNEFNMLGTTYIVNPDITKLSTDQFIQLTRVLKETGPRKRAMLTGLFVWPKGKSFEADNYTKVCDMLYDHCPCSVLLPLSVFFSLLGKACEPHIRNYLNQKTMESLKEVEKEWKEAINESLSGTQD